MGIQRNLERIARDHLNITTLETRGRDHLDFHSVSVQAVQAALLAAWLGGIEEAEEARQNHYPRLTDDMLAAIAQNMDDNLREQLHSARDWNHPGEFLTAYMLGDPGFPLHQYSTGGAT